MKDYDVLSHKIFLNAMEGLLLIHRTFRDHKIKAFLRADDDYLIVGPYKEALEHMSQEVQVQLGRLGFRSPKPEGRFNAWLYDTSVHRRERDDK